jgi:hypothetical protein
MNNPTINYNGRLGRLPSEMELYSIRYKNGSKQVLQYPPFNIDLNIASLRMIPSCNTIIIDTSLAKGLLGLGATSNYGQMGNQPKNLRKFKPLYVRRIDQQLNTY